MSKFNIFNRFRNSIVGLYREKPLIQLLAEENEYQHFISLPDGVLFDVQKPLYIILTKEIERKLR